MNEREARAAIAERSAGRCEACGVRPAVMAAHRKRRSQGGTWDPANLLHVCGSGTAGCEGWITSNPTDAQRLGYQVLGWQDECAVPVLLWSATWGRCWAHLGSSTVTLCAGRLYPTRHPDALPGWRALSAASSGSLLSECKDPLACGWLSELPSSHTR